MPEKSYVGMALCFLCMKPKYLVLDTRLRETLPRETVYDLEPCDECKAHIERGVIVISYDESKTDFSNTIKFPNPDYRKPGKLRSSEPMIDTNTPNFHRTGGWWVVKREAFKKLIEDPDLKDEARLILENATRQGTLFATDGWCEAVGLFAYNRSLEWGNDLDNPLKHEFKPNVSNDVSEGSEAE